MAVAAVSAAEWITPNGKAATATDVLVLAMFVVLDEQPLGVWMRRVLVQEGRYSELGVKWVPPGSKVEGGADGNGRGSVLSEDSGLSSALTYEVDVLRAIARVLHG
eukprot:6170449-Pleurochrysis_carterae.AAC.1